MTKTKSIGLAVASTLIVYLSMAALFAFIYCMMWFVNMSQPSLDFSEWSYISRFFFALYVFMIMPIAAYVVNGAIKNKCN